MNNPQLDEIDLSIQFESYLYNSDEDVFEIGTQNSLIRLRSLGEKGKMKVEIIYNEKFPTDDPPDELDPVDETLAEFGESFNSFDRSSNFYELTIEE